ncbi:MAG: histidine phosphatase family protein [Actinomycetota bacterium]
MHLLVIRHAQPHDESETGGEGDPPLTDLGHAQARAVCGYLQAEGVDHIVASPMVRARQTGEPLAGALGMDIEFDDDLKEAGWQLGAYVRTEENLEHFIEKLREEPDYLYAPEGREVFTERIMRSFTRIANENAGKTVAVFCHGMVTTTLVAHCLGIVNGPDDLHPHYTALTRIQASPGRGLWSVNSFNETMHLQGID